VNLPVPTGVMLLPVGRMADPEARRLDRLAEELEESGLWLERSDVHGNMVLEEIDRALRPPVHEGRIASTGSIVEPESGADSWSSGTQLGITRGELGPVSLAAARRFADGLSSWIIRRADGRNEWVIFDRPAGSERDLVVMASVFGATIVQRHPSGTVRVVGPTGVFRWVGMAWHHERPIAEWLNTLALEPTARDSDVLKAMLAFAVHDLGSLGIGALLVYRPHHPDPGPPVEQRLPLPPPLAIRKAPQLAPLRHAMAQTDGAAFFDGGGILYNLGVRLIPSRTAEQQVDALGGTRHTSGRRYSYDDPRAIVVAVSEAGPVTVFRAGDVLGASGVHRSLPVDIDHEQALEWATVTPRSEGDAL
jgi:hypothetical protein